MLPRHQRLTAARDFRRTLRRGTKVPRRAIIVHVYTPAPAEFSAKPRDIVDFPQLGSSSVDKHGGPRFGLIVSKAVGNAVVRHGVARRLRHICAAVAAAPSKDTGLSASSLIVLRALPSAATATSEELAEDVRTGLAKAQRPRSRSRSRTKGKQ